MKQKIVKKIKLRKETVSTLNGMELRNIEGGTAMVVAPTPDQDDVQILPSFNPTYCITCGTCFTVCRTCVYPCP